MSRERSSRVRGLTLVVAFCFQWLLFPGFVFSDSDELEEIRNAIKAKGARWHADETSLSKLSEKEKKMRLGLRDSEDLSMEYLSGEETAPIPLVTLAPPTLDWRNVNGISYVSPVKNQGSCGSCWAFATTAGLESQYMIAMSGMPVDLSEQILVSCPNGGGTCSGGSSATASNFLRDVGLPLESCFRYTATNNDCSNACANWQENTYKISGWHRASSTTVTVDDIKNALYAYGPVVTTMYVYNDFFSYRSGVYSYVTGSYAGAHAVLTVGYDDEKQAFIVKNSWGAGWGEAGYFMIAYSEVGGTSWFGYSVLVYDGYGANPDPPPPPPPPACSYTLSSAGKNFKASGGSGSVSIYTQSECSWTASTDSSWILITSNGSGTGNGTVSYNVEPNTGAARSAVLTIGGQTYTVTQNGAPRSIKKK